MWDIVHRRDPENIAKLIDALRSIHAYYWEHTKTRLEPEARTLLLPGHHLLQTDFGNLDVLGTVGAKRSYEDLIGSAVETQIAPDLRITVLNLETLIETKKEAGRDKDKAALPVLLRTLEELRAGERT